MGKYFKHPAKRMTIWSLIFSLILPAQLQASEMPLNSEVNIATDKKTSIQCDDEPHEQSGGLTNDADLNSVGRDNINEQLNLDSSHYKKDYPSSQEIDNVIILNDQANNGKFKYVNSYNQSSIFFPELLDNEKTIRLVQGDSWLEVKPKVTNLACGIVKDNTIAYPDIAKGVDLKYTTMFGTLYTEMILKDGTAIDFDHPPSLEFDLTLSNAQLVTNEQGQTTFTDLAGHKDLWYLGPPAMYDGAQNHSYGLKYEIKNNNKSNTETEQSYSLTVSITDLPWLGDFERGWPISISLNIIKREADLSQQDVLNGNIYPDPLVTTPSPAPIHSPTSTPIPTPALSPISILNVVVQSPITTPEQTIEPIPQPSINIISPTPNLTILAQSNPPQASPESTNTQIIQNNTTKSTIKTITKKDKAEEVTTIQTPKVTKTESDIATKVLGITTETAKSQSITFESKMKDLFSGFVISFKEILANLLNKIF